MTRTRLVLLAVLGCLLAGGVLGVRSVSAEPVCTITWNGAHSNEWGNSLNWSGGRLPDASDVVCIPAPTGPGTNDPQVNLNTTVAVVRASRPIALASGSLSLGDTANSSSFSTLTLSGGTLGGDADRTAATLTWASGNLSGAGTTTVTGAATLAGGGDMLPGHELRTEGATTWANGTFYAYDNSIWTNTGDFTVTGSGNLIGYRSGGGVVGVLHNTGTVTKTAGAINDISMGVDNDGTIDRTGGDDLRLTGGGAGSTGTFGDIVVAGGTLVTGAVTLDGPEITGGDLQVEGTSTGSELHVSAGTLSGSGAITVTQLKVSGGVMSGSGSTTATGAFTLSGGNLGPGRVLNTNGPGTWTGGTFYGYDNSVWTNAGDLEVKGDGNLIGYRSGGGVVSVLHNTGTITKTAGSINDISMAVDNDGTIDRTGGDVLRLTGGGTGSTGSFGDIVVAGGEHTTGAVSLDGLEITGGTLSVNGTSTGTGLKISAGALAGTGAITVGTLTVAGGIMHGPGSTTVTGAFTLSGGDLGVGRVLNTNGPGTWTNGTFYGYDNSVWTNAGDLQVKGDGNLIGYRSGGGVVGVLHNTGTITKTAGSINDISMAVDNDGTIDRTGGDVLRLTGGGTGSTGTFGDVVVAGGEHTTGSVTFDGATLTGGTMAVNGPSGGSGLALQGGGTLAGTGAITLGSLTWSGGVMSGTGSTTVNGAFTLSNGDLGNGRVLTTNGSSTWTGGTFYGYDNAVWTNQGDLELTGDGGNLVGYRSGGGVVAVLRNTGTIVKTGGEGGNDISMGVDNDGDMNRTGGGSLRLTGGGAGSTGTFGDVALAGGEHLMDAVTFDGAVISGSTVILSEDEVAEARELTMSYGTLRPLGELAVTGALTTTGGILDGGEGGLITQAAGATSDLDDLALTGRLRLETAGATGLGAVNYYSGATLTWANTGTITTRAGSSLGVDTGSRLVNRGTILVPEDGAFLNGVLVNDGTVRVTADQLRAGTFRQTADGVLSVDLTAAGGSPFSGRVTANEIDYSGTLRVTRSTGHQPANDERVALLVGSTVDGAFRATEGLDLGGGRSYVLEPGMSGIDLVAKGPAPRPADAAEPVAPAPPAPATEPETPAAPNRWTFAVARGARVEILAKPRGVRVRHDRRAGKLRVRATQRARGRLVLRYRVVRPDGRTRVVRVRLRR